MTIFFPLNPNPLLTIHFRVLWESVSTWAYGLIKTANDKDKQKGLGAPTAARSTSYSGIHMCPSRRNAGGGLRNPLLGVQDSSQGVQGEPGTHWDLSVTSNRAWLHLRNSETSLGHLQRRVGKCHGKVVIWGDKLPTQSESGPLPPAARKSAHVRSAPALGTPRSQHGASEPRGRSVGAAATALRTRVLVQQSWHQGSTTGGRGRHRSQAKTSPS